MRKQTSHQNTADNQKTDYSGIFLYQDNELISIFTPAGRLVPDNALWQYEYNLTDHLGNVRTVFAVNQQGTAELRQKTDYYPFGMVMNQSPHTGSSPENKFLYNGKELQDDVIAGTKLDWYDYGWRMYDAAIGRWHVVDPFAEKYPHESPYAYVGNNPLIFIDPDGKEKLIAFKKEDKEDDVLIKGAEAFKEADPKSEIHIFAHGNAKQIRIETDEGTTIIETPEQLVEYLLEKSEVWNDASVEKKTLILHSCETGIGENPIAQKISEHPSFENVTVIAPNGVLRMGDDGSQRIERRDRIVNTSGTWRVFENGERTGSFGSRWRPKAKPNLWDRIYHRNSN